MKRALLGAATFTLAGCGSPLPLSIESRRDPDAAARLRDSAEAHGLAAYRRLHDINVSYQGEWRPLIGRLQPALIDPGHRGSSQERLLPGSRSIAQSHSGPLGHKQVWWRREGARHDDPGQVSVWLDDVPGKDTAVLQTAALVAEGYCLFLLGPLWLVDRDLPMRLGGTEPVDGRPCDIVDVWLSPGLGLVQTDRLSIWIDRSDHVMRRVRFTLEGFEGTQGAVAEVETYDHVQRFGVLWPTRFYERLKHPLPLPVHDWTLTGLDVDRGYGPQALSSPRFSGSAAADAAPFT